MNRLPFNRVQTEQQEEVELLEKLVDDRNLIVFNDDVNTFDHVIDTLIKICKHDSLQAEQCTFIIHYNGKCSVRVGTFEELEPMCTGILERGINAEIQ